MIRSLALSCLAVCLASPVQAGVRHWTARDEACAESLGVPRARGTLKSHPGWLKYLAWSAEIAVMGEVESITHDLDGPYHTLVTVSVSDYWKGSGPSSLVVALHGGPSSTDGRIAEIHVEGEPSFAAGEDVLLFLDKNHLEQTVGDTTFVLPPNHWRLTGRTKLLVDREIIEATPPARTWSLPRARKEVDRIVDAQATQCAVGTP